MTTHLHIDHLVLDGLPVEPGAAPLVRAAVEAELTRLLANGSLTPGLRRGGAWSSVPGEDISVAGNGTPETLGQQISRAVYGGLMR